MQKLNTFLTNKIAKRSLKLIFGGITDGMIGNDPIVIFEDEENPIGNAGGGILPSGTGSVKLNSEENNPINQDIKVFP